jgi:hypothetical protein
MKPGRYVVQDGALCRRQQTREGIVTVPLCNFTARIAEETVFDNGVESSRAWAVEGQLDNGESLPRVTVPARTFSGMGWVAEHWGARARLRAGQAIRDYLREAIQERSSGLRTRRVFTHTGWRQLPSGLWVYLTASGGVGDDSVEVKLDGGLERYALPSEPSHPREAFLASLDLLGIAPFEVTVPLWAAVYRAPLGQFLSTDFSLWSAGTTGSLKSTLAALFLSHFGNFDRLSLPGSWTSTANALEQCAFTLKDTLFVIDDYAPQAGQDARDLQEKAARLLRAQGNRAGRSRLRSDASERPQTPPRGLILSTGEHHPSGQSVLARTLILELDRAGVLMPGLTAAQGAAHRLPHAMAGYLGWLRPQVPTLADTLRRDFAETRARLSGTGPHLRVPEVVAHLWLGVEQAVAYGQAIGVLSPRRADALKGPMWEALLSVGETQGRLVAEERPTLRYLRLLTTLLDQGRVVLVPRDGGPAPGVGHAEFIGWYDEEGVYLLPDAAFAAVSKFGRESGSPFPMPEGRLRRELAKERLSDHDEDRLVKTVRIGGQPRKVLALKRAAVDDALGEPFPVVPIVPGSQE